MKLKDLFSGVVTGKPLKVKNLYSEKDLDTAINSKKLSKQTVTIKNGQTGEVVSKRTIVQK